MPPAPRQSDDSAGAVSLFPGIHRAAHVTRTEDPSPRSHTRAHVPLGSQGLSASLQRRVLGAVASASRGRSCRFATRLKRHVPGFGSPLRNGIRDRLDMNVGKAEFLEPGCDPVRCFMFGRRADDPAPELRVTVVAIALRDARKIFVIAMDTVAIDVLVGGRIRREKTDWIVRGNPALRIIRRA